MRYLDLTALEHLPALPGEEPLDDWEDLSEPALIDVRSLCHLSGVVAILMRRPTLWDGVAVRGRQVQQTVLLDAEVADWLRGIAR